MKFTLAVTRQKVTEEANFLRSFASFFETIRTFADISDQIRTSLVKKSLDLDQSLKIRT